MSPLLLCLGEQVKRNEYNAGCYRGDIGGVLCAVSTLDYFCTEKSHGHKKIRPCGQRKAKKKEV